MAKKPAVYVETYRNYEDSSFQGDWFFLLDYTDADNFEENVEEETEGNPYHITDIENIPLGFYDDFGDGYSIDPKLWELANNLRISRLSFDVLFNFSNFIRDYYSIEDATAEQLIQDFDSSYKGEYANERDFAMSLVEDMGYEEKKELLLPYIDEKDYVSYLLDVGYSEEEGEGVKNIVRNPEGEVLVGYHSLIDLAEDDMQDNVEIAVEVALDLQKYADDIFIEDYKMEGNSVFEVGVI